MLNFITTIVSSITKEELKPPLLTYIDNLRDHSLQLINIILVLPNFIDILSVYITGQN